VNKKAISLVLVFVMVLSLFPMSALAASDKTENSAEVYTASPYKPGPAGSETVAVMVYGKSISEAVHKTGYDFSDFVNALKSELQGVLANEKIPDAELYLVNDAGYEYKLVKNGARDAAFLSAFRFHSSGILGWLEYVVDFIQDVFGWLVDGIDTIGEFYRIYGSNSIPEGDYTLEVRSINEDGYTLWQPESGQVRVHVGDDRVNYVGYEQSLGKHEFKIQLDIAITEIEWTIATVEFTMPGVFYNTVDPGINFKSADCGGNPVADTEFLLVNRDEVENIVKASIKLGKDTFTNAMNLVGTEGFTWDELNVLDKELLLWDNEAQQITFNEEQAMKLLKTYWALVEASAKMPITDFLSDETDIRLPAILQATADENGNVFFGEDCNKTLVWSLRILMEMGDIVLTTAIESGITEGLFENPETQAIVDFVILVAQYAVAQGKELWDENGELVDGFINDWIYPVLQNDNVPGYAKDLVVSIVGKDNIPDKVMEVINMLPTHAILTKKMPAGHYIMFETDAPDGFVRSPLFYTLNLEWHTESRDVRDWCYATVGNVGIILPYYAEDYFTYLREFSAAGTADDIIGKLAGVEDNHIIENTLNGSIDVTAITIAYNAELIYNYMGGNKVYASEAELANALNEYLYTYGRTAQNLIMFAAKVLREAKSVVTGDINGDWTFYNYSTSLRTNHALAKQAIIRGIANAIDTSGKSVVSQNVKDTLNTVADKIDTENHIKEQTTAIQNAVETAVKTTASSIGSKLLNTAFSVTKSLLKWGKK